jgi:hypothetical protein
MNKAMLQLRVTNNVPIISPTVSRQATIILYDVSIIGFFCAAAAAIRAKRSADFERVNIWWVFSVDIIFV